mmetsp:Transcript_11545/g.33201  ORF Transcript_11545/g.33201 Transcript_11545/m.33201 type:complete len:114 (+) Transcript_11545:111-452(+)
MCSVHTVFDVQRVRTEHKYIFGRNLPVENKNWPYVTSIGIINQQSTITAHSKERSFYLWFRHSQFFPRSVVHQFSQSSQVYYFLISSMKYKVEGSTLFRFSAKPTSSILIRGT